MLKSMLVGLSGSPSSQAATKLAIQWARVHHAKLVGVGVLDEESLTSAESIPLGAGAFKAERDEAVLSRAKLLAGIALREFERDCTASDVSHKTFGARGDAAKLLTQHSQRADLLVLGRKRAESTDSAAPLTHTLEQVLKQAVRPVVCVPESPADGNTVLVAYDGSLQAARALSAFVGLGLLADLPIRLVTVERTLGDVAYDTTLASEFLEAHGFQVDVTCFTSDESPSEALLRLIDETRPALVVLGAYGKSWLREVLLGSVTTQLLRKSNSPLFLSH